MLMLPEHSFVPRTSSFPPFWSFFDQFSFFLSFASPLMALALPLIWFSWEISFLFLPIYWLLLQDFLSINWWVGLFCNICCPLVGLFCKDLLPISWLVLQGFLFCSILVSVGLPPEWALFTCRTFGHHSDLTIQYNQQAEYIHLDTSDLTTISTSHSLQLTSRSLLTTLSANHKFKKWKRKRRHFYTSNLTAISSSHILSLFSLMRHLADISIVLAGLQLLLTMPPHHRVRARG